MRWYVLIMAGLLAGQAMAGIYKTYDKNGNAIYSDAPSGGAEEVQTRETMVVPSLPRQVIDQKLNMGDAKKKGAAGAEPSSYQVKITKPLPDAHLQHGDEAFSMEFELTPNLWKGHHVEIYLNGEKIARDKYSPKLDPAELPRGEQRLEVVIVNARGVKVASDAINFNVFQGSEIAPAP
ncbi:uncharacterized protein DUF4124 [Fluviicoccus keumensis]|uniref:Uncharacterized protein DUF4124 n=1 Tax=Fluviicoccus keumensis TaxID=1435465 RepID=A0A4Q7ZBH0_9GAMM|nr:DUF4124 domain-containing protein [Fluviicoccus keumensis]RZU47285.1 uncharacterized protein DUF4124 [Fluviicoccus keumensis]